MDRERDNPTSSPSVANIVATLAERIRAGVYRSGQWLPAERALEQEFGVSRTLIRQAVEELAARGLVLRSPRCRTIVHAGGGLDLSSNGSRRRSLGLWIWPSPVDPAASAIVQGIYQTLDHDTYRVIVGHAVGSRWSDVIDSEARFLERMARDEDIAGIMLWYLGGEGNRPALETVRASGIPMVFLDRRPPDGFEADYVGVDNAYAAEQVVRHLIAQGHVAIAHITNIDVASTVAERRAGYDRALAAAGIAARPELILQEAPRDENEDVFAPLAERLCGMPDRPTAVFAVNDQSALHLLAALRARGVRVPEDIALAGFDGIERWMPGPSFLTTANQPFPRIGARAVELLLQRIETGPDASYRHILLEAPLSIHGSTRAERRESAAVRPL